MRIERNNTQLEEMLESLRPALKLRDRLGYVAARNTRIVREALTEYISFKAELIKKYGSPDKNPQGEDLGTISVKLDSPDFSEFLKELDEIGGVKQSVDVIPVSYEDAIGVLSGEEILRLDWMFVESEVVDSG